MKVAYVHPLPLEYYPPARNTLRIFALRKNWDVRAWSSDNKRGLPPSRTAGVQVFRRGHGKSEEPAGLRAARYALWHLRTAADLARWAPDVLIAVEPHANLAVWTYYAALRGSAKLFIHHHEYYAEQDYLRNGMRLLRASRRIERDSLLERAVWFSQTNATRLALFEKSHPKLRPGAGRVLPNYPPRDWINRVRPDATPNPGVTRLVYVGAASFEDTFIREAALWVRGSPDSLSLHVTGDNVSPDVWAWLESLGAANITTDRNGVDYDVLPQLLAAYDAGLVLYKGNTLNFVHNVPNKAIEYLACGLETWYPAEMEGLRTFHELHDTLPMKQLDFRSLPAHPLRASRREVTSFPFNCETALEPLIAEMERLAGER
jgi:glycosyltransferase involved in cell wall biosynthesis